MSDYRGRIYHEALLGSACCWGHALGISEHLSKAFFQRHAFFAQKSLVFAQSWSKVSNFCEKQEAPWVLSPRQLQVRFW